MVVKIISYNKDLFEEFPDSKYAYHWNGGVAYKAKKNRKYILWIDERETLDFLDLDLIINDKWLSNDFVKLYIFDSRKERKKYIETLKTLKNNRKPLKEILTQQFKNLILNFVR